MVITKKVHFKAFLPATPCTTEMREKIVSLAKKEGASLAEVQRTAFEFFLAEFDKKLNNDELHVIESEGA